MFNKIDPSLDTPLYMQVAGIIKKHLENHPAGHKLPSQRKIAGLLKVSKTTVAEAFNVLMDDGVIVLKEKTRAVSMLTTPGIDWQLFINKAKHVRSSNDAFDSIARTYSKSMLLWPGMDFLPQTPLMEVSEAVAKRIASKDFMNYEDIDFSRLREILAAHLQKSLSISCSPDSIIITSGLSNAIYILASAFLGKFTPILYEAPSYYDPIFAGLDAPSVPLPMRKNGVPPEELRKRVAKNRHAFFMTTPVCHWPTCHMTNRENKKAHYEICRAHDVPIIEVDAMRGLFDAPPPMRSYPDSSRNVIYVGTFTNTIGHSMRLAWIVAPDKTIKRLVDVKSQVEPRISNLIQIFAEEILQTGAYDSYLAALKEKVRNRNVEIEDILSRRLKDVATWHGQPSASRLITFKNPLDSTAVIKMQGRQVSILPLGTLDKSFANSAYMYCAAELPSAIDALVGRLRQAAEV